MDGVIRSVVSDHGRLSVDVDSVGEDTDLYLVGMTSYASVNLMLALEEHYDLEFPEYMLRPATFQSIRTIREALNKLGVTG